MSVWVYGCMGVCMRVYEYVSVSVYMHLLDPRAHLSMCV
jgi:hypothetical protein